MKKPWAILVLLATILLGVGFYSSNPIAPHIPKAHATSRTVVLVGSFSGWNASTNNNPSIAVTQGDSITVQLTSTDTTHQFYVDVNKNGIPDCSNPPTSFPDKCSVFFAPSSSTSFTFTVDFPAGPYTYYCSVHPNTMLGTFTVQATPDFTITANPIAIGPLNTRAAGTSTITVAPTNGFSGTVTLAVSPSSGLNASISPTTIPGGSGTATLSVNSTTAGIYSVTVTGTGSPGTHSATVAVTVVGPDFKITLSSSALIVAPGSSGSVMVTLTSLNGFSGAVALTYTLSPPGPQVTFSPTSVMLSSSGSASSTVSVSAASSGVYSTPVPQGNYNLTVTGTSGGLVHSTALALTVGSPSGAGALPSLAIVGVGIAAAIAIVAGIVYVLRRKPKPKT
jgi:plastocyanin